MLRFKAGQTIKPKNTSRRLTLEKAQLQSAPPTLQAISLWLLSLWASKEKVTRAAAAVRKPAAGELAHADAKTERQRHWIPAYAGMTE
ncbi:hypothetical protein SAMN05216570_0295 [Dyella sp. OK004]|nr:hypothetical protein SAMN05216570_0295 [Dyella sp. OK004]